MCGAVDRGLFAVLLLIVAAFKRYGAGVVCGVVLEGQVAKGVSVAKGACVAEGAKDSVDAVA